MTSSAPRRRHLVPSVAACMDALLPYPEPYGRCTGWAGSCRCVLCAGEATTPGAVMLHSPAAHMLVLGPSSCLECWGCPCHSHPCSMPAPSGNPLRLESPLFIPPSGTFCTCCMWRRPLPAHSAGGGGCGVAPNPVSSYGINASVPERQGDSDVLNVSLQTSAFPVTS